MTLDELRQKANAIDLAVEILTPLEIAVASKWTAHIVHDKKELFLYACKLIVATR